MDDLPIWRCPESTGKHGPADGAGRCPWCRRKYTEAARYDPSRPEERSELSEAYETFYDPDAGTLGVAEREGRYRSG